MNIELGKLTLFYLFSRIHFMIINHRNNISFKGFSTGVPRFKLLQIYKKISFNDLTELLFYRKALLHRE